MLRISKFVVALAFVFMAGGTPAQAATLLGNSQFWRSDVNQDGRIDLSDAVSLLAYLFQGGAVPTCLEAADVDDSGDLDIADPINLLNFLFLAGKPPAAPYPQIDIDPTTDSLGCKPVFDTDPTVITADITTSQTWDNQHTWYLNGKIFIRSPAILTIEPGTTILGDLANKALLAADRGAQIIANGTPTQPIVFTSAQAYGHRQAHDWGGVLMIGRADNNYPGHEADAEGFPPEVHIQFGPEDHVPRIDDKSGELSYVRIEFGGTVISPNNEINGLSLFSVGRGTKLHHINVRFNADDAIEWFGGNADVKYVYNMGCQDDQIDHSFGARFRCQFVVAQLVGNGCDRGFEVDDNESNFTDLPRTRAVCSNWTFVGDPFYTPTTTVEQGLELRRGCGGVYLNGIVMGFPKGGLNIDDAETTNHNPTNGYLIADYITFFQNGAAPLFNQPMGQLTENPANALFNPATAAAFIEDAAHGYLYTSETFTRDLNPHNNTATASPIVGDPFNHFQTDGNNRPVFTYQPSAEVTGFEAYDQRNIQALVKPTTFVHSEDANGSDPANPTGTANGIYSADWGAWFDYAPWRGAIVPSDFDKTKIPAGKEGEDCYRDWTHDTWISTAQS